MSAAAISVRPGFPKAATSRLPRSCSENSITTATSSNTTPPAPAVLSRCAFCPKAARSSCSASSPPNPARWKRKTTLSGASTRRPSSPRWISSVSRRNAALPRPRKATCSPRKSNGRSCAWWWSSPTRCGADIFPLPVGAEAVRMSQPDCRDELRSDQLPAAEPLVHMHHQRHGEQRRRQIDDRDRDEGRDEQAAYVNRHGVALAQRLGFGRRPETHGGQLEIFAPENVGGGEKEDHHAKTGKQQKRHRAEIDDDRQQRRLATF